MCFEIYQPVYSLMQSLMDSFIDSSLEQVFILTAMAAMCKVSFNCFHSSSPKPGTQSTDVMFLWLREMPLSVPFE